MAGAAVVALGLGGLLAGVVAELGPAGAAPAGPAIDPGTVLSGFGRNSGTATTVAQLEGELARSGPDADRLDDLGLAYQVRWRETGDAAFLPLSERALRGVLSLRPKDATATLALGNLALIRHDFRGALALGREAQRRAPYAARPYGVVGDALVELGRYRAAFATFDRMTALKPSVASYARVAYARELRGDRAGARSAMGLALDAAGGVPEPTAWAHVELAKLDLGDGRTREAKAHVDAALTVFPGYVLALEQRARVEAAEGRLAAAVATARRAVASVPLPQFVALLGDLLDREGRREQGSSPVGDRGGPSTGCWQRTGCGSTSSRRCSAPTTGCAPPRQSASPVVRGPPDRPSTETTRSAGRSPGQGAATRQCPCSTAHCGSGRETRSSTSTAGTRPAVPETAPEMRDWYRKALDAEPRVLGAVGACRPKGHSRETRRCAGGRPRSRHGRGTRTTGRRRRAPARELHRQPLRGHRARRQPRVRAATSSTSPRSRRTRTADASARPGTRQTLARELELRHRRNTQPASCRSRTACRQRPGAGGLPTLRFEAIYRSVTRRPVGCRSPTARSRAGSAGGRSRSRRGTVRGSSAHPCRR